MKLKLNKISIDGGTQPREDIDEDIVSEYAEAMKEGDMFPPVVVFNDGAKYWLADGFHRYHASNKIGFLDVEAEVKQGTKRDAVLYSVSANSKHGLRRTNADKRKAVLTLLNDEEWSGWPQTKIAEHCAVNQSTVSRIASELGESSSYAKHKIKKVKRGDQEYTVDTSNIGKHKEPVILDGMVRREIKDRIDSGEYDGLDSLEAFGSQYNEVAKKDMPTKSGNSVGMRKATEAISILKEIPPKDESRDDALDYVLRWINTNK